MDITKNKNIDSVKGPEDYFTGSVRLDPLFSQKEDITKYHILPINNQEGFIEIIPNAVTLYELRKNADRVLLDGMKQAEPKVPKWKQKACYRVVRMFGGLTLRHSSYRERHDW